MAVIVLLLATLQTAQRLTSNPGIFNL
jgi:hypothetical protein